MASEPPSSVGLGWDEFQLRLLAFAAGTQVLELGQLSAADPLGGWLYPVAGGLLTLAVILFRVRRG